MCYKRKKEVTDKSSCVTVKLEYNKQTQKGDIRHEHCNTSIVNQQFKKQQYHYNVLIKHAFICII